jgi:multidrug resistance efflux pump
VAQACAALGAAAAFHDHIHAGVRAEEVDGLAVEIAKAKAKLEYAQVQLTRTAPLAQSDTATQRALDQAKNDVAAARPDVAEAQAKCCACLGPDLALSYRAAPAKSVSVFEG